MKLFLALNYLICMFLVIPFSFCDPSKVALHPERLKFLEDALSWLTLRSDGTIVTDPNLNYRLVNALHGEYKYNLYFRTLVIAFQLGVLPKLTLQHGQPCDPSYTLRYRSEFNNSVTWYKVRNFTLQNYHDLKKPGSLSGPYCDYRKGLVCLPTTKTCDCPQGTKMGPIEADSQVQRCLLEEDEICQLADLSTYNRDIGILFRKLPEIVFNLEKPPSCKHGTTCRVKDSPFTKCLSLSKAPFQDNGPTAKYGEECIIDYVGEGRVCEVKTDHHKASVCFNFRGYLQNKRSSSSSVPKNTGLCALDVAPYITPGIGSYSQTVGSPTTNILYPFLTAFVNPGTVKMSSSELLEYDQKLHDIIKNYNQDGGPPAPWEQTSTRRIQRNTGGPCFVSHTDKMVDIWNFYAGLEKDPPQGQEFVADVPTLQAKLTEFKSLIDNHTAYEPRICRIYWEKFEYGPETPPLTCVSTGGAPDDKGNDGTCQISSNNDTYALVLDIHNYAKDDYKSKDEVRNGNTIYNPMILWDNPEAQCIRSQIKSRSSSRDWPEEDPHSHGEVLEGGNCTEGFACLEELDEIHGIYKNPKNKEDCNFVEGYQPRYTCLDVLSTPDKVKWDTCEMDLINERVMKAVEAAPRLAMGAPCNDKLEDDIYYFYSLYDKEKTNRYRILSGLETFGICDQTKLLRCTDENICGCGKYRVPRESADKKYMSDYCYMAVGPCRRTVSEELVWVPVTEAEKNEMNAHYGVEQRIGPTCKGGNVCRFIDACESECTDFNTGSTGFDVDIVGGCVQTTTTTTTTTTTPTTTTEEPPWQTDEPTSRPLEPVAPFDGAELSSKKQNHMRVLITIIIILKSFKTANWDIN